MYIPFGVLLFFSKSANRLCIPVIIAEIPNYSVYLLKNHRNMLPNSNIQCHISIYLQKIYRLIWYFSLFNQTIQSFGRFLNTPKYRTEYLVFIYGILPNEIPNLSA